MNKNTSPLKKELQQDWETLKRLDTHGKLVFLWDYYKWRALVCVCVVVIIGTFAHMLWEGQKPRRLRLCRAEYRRRLQRVVSQVYAGVKE